MGFCTVDGDAKEMARSASDLYSKVLSGDKVAALDFANVMNLGINGNNDCGGHNPYVQEVFKELSGPLASVAVLGVGERTDAHRLEKKFEVDEIHVPLLDFGKLGKNK